VDVSRDDKGAFSYKRRRSPSLVILRVPTEPSLLLSAYSHWVQLLPALCGQDVPVPVAELAASAPQS
jgi:hypothetical protein